ncbi:MAG: bifunctional phosphoglucose/phosphomannose isomerase [Candidatus Bathyarchaeales archaeon]
MPKTTILDDLNAISKIDRNNMLSFCVEAAKHYEDAFKMAKTVTVNYSKPKAIIAAGMGGSAIGGELLKDWTRDTLKIPVEVCRDYILPAYADEKTLTLIVSYSGETEETLSTFLDAVKRKCMVVCISSGGALTEFAEKMNVPHLRVPSGVPPRAALPYLFIPLLVFMDKLGLASNVKMEISEAIEIMRQVCEENAPQKPLKENFSKMLASNISGTVPVIYGFGLYRSVAQRFKQQFNENSKVPSKWDVFSELNHNEVVGWERAESLSKCFSAIILRDKSEPEKIRCRIEATKELMRDKISGIYEVWSRGEGRLAKMLSTTLIGDFTSVYLALLREIDPTPVETINLLKRKIAETGTRDKILHELKTLSNNMFGQ